MARTNNLADHIARFLHQARDQGVRIVHSPSGTLDFYREHPARKRAILDQISIAEYPNWYPRDPLLEPSLPIDDTDGGCACTPACTSRKVFARQTPRLSVEETDAVSTDLGEILALFDHWGVQHILIVGVHLNMCVLGRSFGIRQWLKRDRDIVLVRDLTDVMYNPAMAPGVPLGQALDLVVTHIEHYLCPSVLSHQLFQDQVASTRCN